MTKKIVKHNDQNALRKAKEILCNGGMIAYPTDTIYGLGVDARNRNAIKKINDLKERKGPISVICNDKITALSWLKIPKSHKKNALAKLEPYMTLICPVKTSIVNKIILGKNNTLGIRIPQNKFCVLLSENCGFPITTTSINKTGQVPEINAETIFKKFGDKIDLIIDQGELNNPPSLIYKYKSGEYEKVR